MNRTVSPQASALMIVSALFILLLPVTAAAFQKGAVDRDSFSISDQGVGVFTLHIVVGAWNEDLYLPVVGERGLPFASRVNRFGFELESGYPHQVSDAGTVTALMVAPFEIVDGYYKIPARTLASVKIIALATIDESESNTYNFRITELPFLIGEDKRPGHFSNGEMKYLFTNKEAFHYEYDPE